MRSATGCECLPPIARPTSLRPSAHPDARLDRHPRPERTVAWEILEHDFHGHALHHLDEIPGGVLRWQKRERLAGAALNRVDARIQVHGGAGIDVDRDALTRPD